MDALTTANVALITPATTTIETICARHYDLTRRSLYESYHYNFAKRYATLQPQADAPEDGWGAKFRLPTDYCQIIAIEDDNLPLTQYPYDLRGRFIYADYDGNLPLYYTADITDPNEMPASFVYYLAAELAMNTAKACGAKDERLLKLAALVKDREARAKTNASKTKPGKIFFGSRMYGAAATYTGPSSPNSVGGIVRKVM